METDEVLLPYMSYLLQDLWSLGSAVDQIIGVVKDLDLISTSTVLDLGCGKGAVCIRIASELRCKVTGVDAMPEFITDAEKKAAEHNVINLCKFIEDDIRDFTSAPHEFDVVILASLGGIFGSIDQTIKALRTQVKPNGYMIIDDGYLKTGKMMNRNGYEHLTDHEETIRKLTAFNDILLHEESTSEISRKINEEYLVMIKSRGKELIELKPELKDKVESYIALQKEECIYIDENIEGVLWLLQKT